MHGQGRSERAENRREEWDRNYSPRQNALFPSLNMQIFSFIRVTVEESSN